MIKYIGATADQAAAIAELTSDVRRPEVTATVTLVAGAPGLKLTRSGDTGSIVYGSLADLMRGVSLWAGLAQDGGDFALTQKPQFKQLGAMLDLARNGVATVPMLKRFIRRLASMGYNQLWLYLEDEFEVPEEPYFGHQRGRYSQADLHELALYGDRFGVKLIPAIQTLAHMRNALKWDTYADIRDTADIVMVGSARTETFLRHLLKAASAPFTTNKIHIGMDEAYDLGHGRYMAVNGYADQEKLIKSQLKLVVSICQELKLQPQMWSDLWFTYASKKHEMYDPDVHFDAAYKASLPKVTQMYWDYYQEDPQKYLDRFKQHFELSDDIIFAGGIWTWGSLVPDQSKMLATVDAGLSAAKKAGIEQVVATMWFDDGADTPISSAWFGLQAFAAYQYHAGVDAKTIDTDYALMQGESAKPYRDLDLFDNFTQGGNLDADNPSKIVLYEDLILQRYAQNLAPYDLRSRYAALAKRYANVAAQPGNQVMWQYYAELAKTLVAKLDALAAVAKLRFANEKTKSGDKAVAAVTAYRQQLAKFTPYSRQLWHQQRRGSGYEVIDIRLGGQDQRAETTIWRIKAWQAGQDSLAELHEKQLPMDKHTNGAIGHGLYKEIVSPSELSF